MIENESQIRLIGYGAMLMESSSRSWRMIAATVLASRRLFRHEQPCRPDRHDAATPRRSISSWGFVVTPDMLTRSRRMSARRTHPVAHRRCADAGGRHGANPVGLPRRPGMMAHLVSLRDPVRGAVHPHDSRRRHPRAPLHDPGHDRQCGPAFKATRLVDRTM